MPAYTEPGKCDRPGCGNQREQRANSDRYWNQTCGDDECLNWRNSRYQQEYRRRLVDAALRAEQGYDLDLPLAHLSPEQHTRLTHSVEVALAAANRLGGATEAVRKELVDVYFLPEDDADRILGDAGLTGHTATIKNRLDQASDLLYEAEHLHDLWQRRQTHNGD